jgi:chromosome segregation ATPase
MNEVIQCLTNENNLNKNQIKRQNDMISQHVTHIQNLDDLNTTSFEQSQLKDTEINFLTNAKNDLTKQNENLKSLVDKINQDIEDNNSGNAKLKIAITELANKNVKLIEDMNSMEPKFKEREENVNTRFKHKSKQ